MHTMIRKKNITLISVIILTFYSPFISSQLRVVEEKLWNSGIPDQFKHPVNEATENRNFDQNEYGFNRSISNVSDPTISVFPAPEHINTGVAVLIFPGGGYRRIAIDKEGYDVARWLNTLGITGIVVKYRTIPNDISIRGEDTDFQMRNIILSDALEAFRVSRRRAMEWKIDPNKLGVMGFSAGGHLTALLCSSPENKTDSTSGNKTVQDTEPNFMVLIYPALGSDFKLADFNRFPPAFMITCNDDKTAPSQDSIDFFNSLINRNKSELHVYSKGGHGFGLGIRGGSVSGWKLNLISWLRDIHFLE